MLTRVMSITNVIFYMFFFVGTENVWTFDPKAAVLENNHTERDCGSK